MALNKTLLMFLGTLSGCLLGALIFAPVVNACAGPGARELVDANIKAAYVLAALGLAFHSATVIFYFLRGKKGLFIVIPSIIILATHPAWTGSATGDCGASKAFDSLVSTSMLLLAFLLQLTLWLVQRYVRRRT
jgi:hypothetical protein